MDRAIRGGRDPWVFGDVCGEIACKITAQTSGGGSSHWRVAARLTLYIRPQVDRAGGCIGFPVARGGRGANVF